MPETESLRAELAALTGRDEDPLAELEPTFEAFSGDPFEMFIAECMSGSSADTRTRIRRVYRQWREHMTEEGRHPACPHVTHIRSFATHLRTKDERPNADSTIRGKLRALNRAYEYWQRDAVFPIPTDYNPYRKVLANLDTNSETVREFPRLDIEAIRAHVADVTHCRDRAIVVMQLKLGLRAGEIANIKLSDLSIAHDELDRHYPALGSHDGLDGHENAIYIPPREGSPFPVAGRKGNKSRRPGLLPLDDETRRVLVRYLLNRPAVDEPWLFLTKQRFGQLDPTDPLRIWEAAFPEYQDDDEYRRITSHYGRHWFTTYWTVHEDLNPELVGYMRRDKAGAAVEEHGALQYYIHTFYEDIEAVYRDRIFKLEI